MTEERELVISRTFDAPRERVWQAWTEPEQLMRWWGPKDYTSPVAEIELRPDGKYLFSMRSPEGQNYFSAGIYREIVPLERVVFTDSFADEEGNIVPASHYGMDADFPIELVVTVTLEDVDGQTKMTLRHSGIPPGDMTDMTAAGWNESFDKLAEDLRVRQDRAA